MGIEVQDEGEKTRELGAGLCLSLPGSSQAMEDGSALRGKCKLEHRYLLFMGSIPGA